MTKELDAGKMFRPTDIAADIANDAVYVVEQYNHRVSKWDYTPGVFTFTLDGTWGSNGDGTSFQPGVATASNDEFLNFPTGIALNSAGDLLVTDTLNNRIRVVDAALGTTFDTFGTPGTGAGGQYYRPVGIDIDASNDRVMIADSFNHRVQTSSALTPYAFITFTDAATPVALHTPKGITASFNGFEFYVSDTVKGILNRYDEGGFTFIGQLGSPGTEAQTELFHPGAGHLGGGVQTVQYFADTNNNIIKRSAGTPIADIINNPGTGSGQQYHPESVILFTDTANYVLVANTLNNRVDVFDNTGPTLQSTFGAP